MYVRAHGYFRVVKPESITAIERLVQEIGQMVMSDIATHLDTSHGSARHIIHDVPRYQKVSARGGAMTAYTRIETTTH